MPGGRRGRSSRRPWPAAPRPAPARGAGAGLGLDDRRQLASPRPRRAALETARQQEPHGGWAPRSPATAATSRRRPRPAGPGARASRPPGLDRGRGSRVLGQALRAAATPRGRESRRSRCTAPGIVPAARYVPSRRSPSSAAARRPISGTRERASRRRSPARAPALLEHDVRMHGQSSSTCRPPRRLRGAPGQPAGRARSGGQRRQVAQEMTAGRCATRCHARRKCSRADVPRRRRSSEPRLKCRKGCRPLGHLALEEVDVALRLARRPVPRRGSRSATRTLVRAERARAGSAGRLCATLLRERSGGLSLARRRPLDPGDE